MSGISWKRSEALGLGDIARGAVGIAKVALGADLAPDCAITERYRLCASCSKNDRGVCVDCGCFIGAKIRLGSSFCPAGHWTAVTVEGAEPKQPAKKCGCAGRNSQ